MFIICFSKSEDINNPNVKLSVLNFGRLTWSRYQIKTNASVKVRAFWKKKKSTWLTFFWAIIIRQRFRLPFTVYLHLNARSTFPFLLLTFFKFPKHYPVLQMILFWRKFTNVASYFRLYIGMSKFNFGKKMRRRVMWKVRNKLFSF